MSQIRRSAAWPINVAVVAALGARATLLDRLAAGMESIIAGRAPRHTPMPYITVPQFTEGRSDTFMNAGSETTQDLDVWTAGDDQRTALAIYDEIVQAIDGQPLAVDGHTLYTGALTLVSCAPDADGQSIHLKASYRARSRVG